MVKKEQGIQGKDSFHRINYLYQASKIVIKNVSGKSDLDVLSTYYSNLLINIGKKSVLRIDQDIKRNICKGCRSVLIPSHNTLVRYNTKGKHCVYYKCLKCGTVKRFNTLNRNYKTWSETPESCVSVIDFTKKNKEYQSRCVAKTKIETV